MGVTGTNGKTTIATSFAETLLGDGIPYGTHFHRLRDYWRKETKQTHHTGCSFAPELSHEMVEWQAVSMLLWRYYRHSISTVRGTHFAGAVFTNLTRDHLDYHGTFLNYLHAKRSFFDGLTEGAGTTNIDDSNGAVMVQTAAELFTPTPRGMPTLRGKAIMTTPDGTDLILNGTQVSTRW